MIAFLTQRLVQSLAVLLVVALAAFVLCERVGDPATQWLGQDATPARRDALRHELGLDAPLPTRVAHFVVAAARGDFGHSLRQGRPVAAVFAERLPATAELAATAGVLALLVGIPVGVYTALHASSVASRLLLLGSLVGVSLPTFLIGMLLILTFSVRLRWLPSSGRGEIVDLGGWTTGWLTADGWRHLLMPAVTLALFQLTLIVRLVRGELRRVLRSPFIRSARARGLSERTIAWHHALPHVWAPVAAIAALQFGAIVAFAAVTETVFQWPGMGLLFIESVQSADIPVMAAYLCWVALLYLGLNLLVDALHLIADPRLRTPGAGVAP